MDALRHALEHGRAAARFAVATQAGLAWLRGRLPVWLLEVRAGVYVGTYGRRVRQMIRAQVCAYVADGNGVIVWAAPSDADFEFQTCGRNRRIPVDLI